MSKKSLAVLAIALAVAGSAAAQNVAIVNGKAVPKARLDLLMQQATRGGQQPVTPELEARARDEVVLREIFAQEAEKRGVAASAEYRSQMELARQTILIRELFADYQKKNPVSDAEAKAEYDKFKAQSTGTEYRARHILVEKEDEAKSLLKQLIAGAKFDELAKKHSTDKGSGANGGDLDFAKPDAYVPEFGQAMAALKKGETTADAGEEPVRLAHHQARRHARGAVPALRRGQAADPAAPGPAEGAAVPGRPAQEGQDGLQVRRAVSAVTGPRGACRAYLTDTRTGMRRRPKPRSKRGAKRPATARAAVRAAALGIERVVQHRMPVALDQRCAAAGAERGAAFGVVHVAGVDMAQAVGQRDAGAHAPASRPAWRACHPSCSRGGRP